MGTPLGGSLGTEWRFVPRETGRDLFWISCLLSFVCSEINRELQGQDKSLKQLVVYCLI